MALTICQDHWDALRAAIDARGLTPLVSEDGRAAIEASVAELRGIEASVAELRGDADAATVTYDPLLSAYYAILNRGLQIMGMGPMFGEEKTCVVCQALEHSPIDSGDGDFRDRDHVLSHWIDGPADMVLEHVRATPVLCAMLGWEHGEATPS